MHDASHPEDPTQWARRWQEDQSFRTQHAGLFLALEALRSYLSQSSLEMSEEQRSSLQDWANESAPDDLDQVALSNFRRVLRDYTGPQADRAQSLLSVLGPGEIEAAEPPPPSQPTDIFRIQGITLESHFLDSDFRPLPSYLTLGTLPHDGLGQVFNSTATVRAGFEAQLGPLGIFGQIYGGDGRPDGSPAASFGQFGLLLGFQEYNRGIRISPIEGFHISILGGVSRVGMGLGVAWCDHIDGSDVSGASCHGENTFQLSAINESDVLSIGVGPVELGVRLFPNTVYWNPGTSVLPESDRDPFSLRLTYYLEPPRMPQETSDPNSVFWQHLTDGQLAFTGASLFSNFVQNNTRRRTEAAYERARIQFALPSSSDSTYSQLNLGTTFGGVLNGLAEGGLAYRLGRDLHMGNTAQQAVLGALMGLDTLIPFIGTLSTPGEPDEAAYRRGETRGITDLQAQAFRMSLPTVTTRNALGILEALGAFGDRDQAVREGGIQYFHVAHGLLALGGVALILTSGDLSGNGFLGWSILGNQFPNTSMVEIPGSRFSAESQRFQFYRLEAGAMALSLGVQGILDALLTRSRYLELQEAQRRGEERREPSTQSGTPVSASLETDGHSRVMVSVGGSF